LECKKTGYIRLYSECTYSNWAYPNSTQYIYVLDASLEKKRANQHLITNRKNMTIFLSSTCYDLKDLRAELENFLQEKGHSLLLSDRANFPVNIGTHRHDVCIENVQKCDLYVLVIDSRFGAKYYKNEDISITWAEFKEAIRTERKIMSFVRKEVFNERLTFKQTKKDFSERLKTLVLEGKTIAEKDTLKIISLLRPFITDNEKTFDFIDEIQSDKRGIWCQPFDDSTDVKMQLENIYATKHSLLNPIVENIQISSSEIPLTTLSGSTASFITSNYDLGNNKIVSAEILQLAIDKIPEEVKPLDEIVGFESIPNYSNDFFYFFPLHKAEDDGETIVGISPTALGHSVRNELKGALKRIDDEKNAIGLFTDTVKRKPVLCRSCVFENKSYIIGFYEKDSGYSTKTQHLCMLNLFANKWQTFYDESIDEYDCYPELSDNCKIIIHDKKIFLYFERIIHRQGTMYNGTGIVEFAVFDFKNKTINKLIYEGIYRSGKIEGEFNLESLKENPNSTTYEFILEQEASKSKYIYRTPKDYNIDDAENYIEKWNIENPDFYNNEYGNVILNYYDDNILWDTKNYEDINIYKKNVDHIENKNFIIFYYFAGPILAVRKKDRKYFVILVPQGYGAGGSWGIRSIKTVKFLTAKKIFAQNDYEKYEIDLETTKYIRRRIEVNDDMVKRRLKNAGISE